MRKRRKIFNKNHKNTLYEIDFPEGGNDISDKTVWELAHNGLRY